MKIVTIGEPGSGADVAAQPERFHDAIAAAFASSPHVQVWPGRYSAAGIVEVPACRLLDLGDAHVRLDDSMVLGEDVRLTGGVLEGGEGTVVAGSRSVISRVRWRTQNADPHVLVDDAEGVLIEGCEWWDCAGQVLRVTRSQAEGGHLRMVGCRVEKHMRRDDAGDPVPLIALEEGVRFGSLSGLQIGRAKVGGAMDAPVILVAGSATLPAGGIVLSGLEIHNSGATAVRVEHADGVSIVGLVHSLAGPNPTTIDVDSGTTANVSTAGVVTAL